MIEEIEFINLNKLSYLKYRDQITELYFQAFTTGSYAQYLNRNSVESTMDELIKSGGGILALSVDRLVGILAATPLSEHLDLPLDNFKELPPEKTIYINEVIVDEWFRGRGIAKKMLSIFLNNIADRFQNAVIRVWDKNSPAISLYSKLNFEPFAYITQTKLNVSGEEFQMNKIYLHKKIDN